MLRQQTRVHIRWMIRRDYPEVLEIEQASFVQGVWSEEDLLTALRHRNCIGTVAEQGEKVVGFMVYSLRKTELHILNFAIHPSCRRQSIGTQMVVNLISKLSSHRRTRITLIVRETNLAAQLFFQAMGFTATDVLSGHYQDQDPPGSEDAYRMEYRLAHEEDEYDCATNPDR